jgi:hypothetical protein
MGLNLIPTQGFHGKSLSCTPSPTLNRGAKAVAEGRFSFPRIEHETMNTWVLILTLVGTGTTGSAIYHVPGFATETECDAAGLRWKTSEEKPGLRSTTCVDLSGASDQAFRERARKAQEQYFNDERPSK